MHRSLSKLTRWAAAAALVAVTLGHATPGEAAFKRLFVLLNRTGPAGCANDAAGNPYYASAGGWTATNSQACIIDTTGSTAQTLCPTTAVAHNVAVSKLLPSGAMQPLTLSPVLPSVWTDTKTSPAFSIPAHATCPAGNTATAGSVGGSFF